MTIKYVLKFAKDLFIFGYHRLTHDAIACARVSVIFRLEHSRMPINKNLGPYVFSTDMKVFDTKPLLVVYQFLRLQTIVNVLDQIMIKCSDCLRLGYLGVPSSLHNVRFVGMFFRYIFFSISRKRLRAIINSVSKMLMVICISVMRNNAISIRN